MNSSIEGPDRPSRFTILRDLLVFQVKLWLEGLKDIALVPLSIGAAVLDILFRKTTGQGTLYALMRAGDRFEEWVNLYGALEKRPQEDSIFPVSFLEAEGGRQSAHQEALEEKGDSPHQDPDSSSAT